jgi:hypothetical protein
VSSNNVFSGFKRLCDGKSDEMLLGIRVLRKRILFLVFCYPRWKFDVEAARQVCLRFYGRLEFTLLNGSVGLDAGESRDFPRGRQD